LVVSTLLGFGKMAFSTLWWTYEQSVLAPADESGGRQIED
jgi:hypothetical protein